jgi:uncharacterized protein (TIGR02058 family)
MQPKRIILELGAGNDLHGGDYTKAAIRAVQDALHHSSMTWIRAFGVDSKQMQVDVTIGVQQPDKVDTDKVKATLPHGIVTVKAVKGGLDVPDPVRGDIAVFASATQAVLICRLDNLGKGASGAAVQSMNVHLGLDEGLGL